MANPVSLRLTRRQVEVLLDAARFYETYLEDDAEAGNDKARRELAVCVRASDHLEDLLYCGRSTR